MEGERCKRAKERKRGKLTERALKGDEGRRRKPGEEKSKKGRREEWRLGEIRMGMAAKIYSAVL